MPFSSILTRAPSRPRMMGRDAPAPNADADTPSSCDSVSPSELPDLSRNSSPASTLAGARIWSLALLPKGVAVTTTCGTTGSDGAGASAACACDEKADRIALASSVRCLFI
jgi:hypothetical protein